MKLISKPRLPKWLIALLPFKEEDSVLSEFMVPLILFSVIGLGIIWYDLCYEFIPYLGVIVTVLIIVLVAIILWWLTVHIDVLRILRERLVFHYRITDNEDEKFKTKERLKDLCMKV